METPAEKDLRTARKLLHKHGYAAKIFGPEDVRDRLRFLPDVLDAESIIKHVMEGDDWSSMEEETSEDDANIFALIDGTRGDHPEWFAPEPEPEPEEEPVAKLARLGVLFMEDTLKRQYMRVIGREEDPVTEVLIGRMEDTAKQMLTLQKELGL